jgi:hypothetical protein
MHLVDDYPILDPNEQRDSFNLILLRDYGLFLGLDLLGQNLPRWSRSNFPIEQAEFFTSQSKKRR